MSNRTTEELTLEARVTALRADALTLATMVNAYAGNLDLLRQMQELSRKVLVQLRKIEEMK